MPRVKLKLFAHLRSLLPTSDQLAELEVQAQTTAGEVLSQVGVPADAPLIVFINGRHAELSTYLEDGDTLSVFPPIAGG